MSPPPAPRRPLPTVHRVLLVVVVVLLGFTVYNALRGGELNTGGIVVAAACLAIYAARLRTTGKGE